MDKSLVRQSWRSKYGSTLAKSIARYYCNTTWPSHVIQGCTIHNTVKCRHSQLIATISSFPAPCTILILVDIACGDFGCFQHTQNYPEVADQRQTLSSYIAHSYLKSSFESSSFQVIFFDTPYENVKMFLVSSQFMCAHFRVTALKIKAATYI